MTSAAKATVRWAVIVFCLYTVVAISAYRFRHPEKTETQLFLEIPQALVWK